MNWTQAIFNKSMAKHMVLCLGIIFCLSYLIFVGQDVGPRNAATLAGLRFGQSVATTTLLAKQIKAVESNPTTVLPDLSPEKKILEAVQAETAKVKPNATALSFLAPLIKQIGEYQSLATSNQEAARKILVNGIKPSNNAYKLTLDETMANIPWKLEENQNLRRIITGGFVIFGFGSMIVLLSMLASVGTKVDFSLNLLRTSLTRPHVAVLASSYRNRLGDEDEETKKSIGNILFSTISVPHPENFQNRRQNLFEFDHDIAHEIRGAAAYAHLLSNGESKFDVIPDGLLPMKMEHNSLEYALILWMEQVASQHKVKIFDLTHEKVGSDWRFILSTRDKAIDPIVATGFQDILAKKYWVSKDHDREIDFVRAVLKRYTKSTTVNNENGNLNLVMTFTPQ